MNNQSSAYENRFRDPAFLAIWDRWRKAWRTWEQLRKTLPMDQGGPDSYDNPDLSCITDSKHLVCAEEFLEARKAYKAELTRLWAVQDSQHG